MISREGHSLIHWTKSEVIKTALYQLCVHCNVYEDYPLWIRTWVHWAYPVSLMKPTKSYQRLLYSSSQV